MYVVHADKELSVIDAKDYSVRQPIALPTSLGAFKLESSRPRMYANAKNDGVIAIDTEQDKIIGRFPVAPAGVNAAVAIDEPNHRLFIGCRKNPSLVVMDSDTGKILASVPIPGDVDDLSFDARRGRIYASCGEAAIAVIRQIDADRYESLATIPTVEGARTSIFSPETDSSTSRYRVGGIGRIRKTRRSGSIRPGRELRHHESVAGDRLKWVTRENAKVDRIACPWLIRRFIDRDAEFLYVPADQVMAVAEREGAIPYDTPGVELGHVDGAAPSRASFSSQPHGRPDPRRWRRSSTRRTSPRTSRPTPPAGA